MEQKVLAYSIKDACRVSGLGRTTLYVAVKAGVLSVRKFGRRSLILAADLEKFLLTLPTSSQSGAAFGDIKAGEEETLNEKI